MRPAAAAAAALVLGLLAAAAASPLQPPRQAAVRVAPTPAAKRSPANAVPVPAAAPTVTALLAAYKDTHRAILASPERRQRELLVFKCDTNGLGDRFVSAVSVFIMAVLTNRAFQVGSRR
jgi:hypothetical protein